jgi:hypothetical protein
MTEIRDGPNILYTHIAELFALDVIDVEEKQRLQDEIRIIEDDLKYHYEKLGEQVQERNRDHTY